MYQAVPSIEDAEIKEFFPPGGHSLLGQMEK